ncbi:M14-type cytosolic carboxypeptidase [Desulfoluna sp.]|uniref:M14-type cytosolic carboxypeptidase n=1 Tax=Desulfoluna sp. TaxID=2045199 RepID=UPI00261E1D76|nr:M14-type cytosolic carboxypeptidase [Desulfoluna sp.]
MHHRLKWLIFVGLVLCVCSGCGEGENTASVTRDFESGSIGEVRQVSPNEWALSLADDNGNPELSDRWRAWWYVRMDDIDPDRLAVIHLKNRGWSCYYTPVYSYDQKTWHRFSEEEVSQPGDFELTMKKKFASSTVWMARFYPYTYSDLTAYIGKIKNNPHVDIETPATTQNKKPIYLLTLSDFDVDDSGKKRVWMHARTHPAETGPSFVLEGLIDFLLSGTREADAVLSQFIFHIVPMQNIDGVMAGNYRTTPLNENLEVMWYSDPGNPLPLTSDAPVEVTALHHIVEAFMSQEPAISIALNLHASNSDPDVRPFFFPHFGTVADGYTVSEASLWKKQIRFINSMGGQYGVNMLEPVPAEGGRSFATKMYPESWWWKNFKDSVMAITMETTYGRAGYGPDWITPDDLRCLGESLALGLRDYADPSIHFEKSALMFKGPVQKYEPSHDSFYPPADPGEMKEQR